MRIFTFSVLYLKIIEIDPIANEISIPLLFFLYLLVLSPSLRSGIYIIKMKGKILEPPEFR